MMEMRFRLRTLLILMAVASAFMAYEVNWIRQRRLFLAAQLAQHESAWAQQPNHPYKNQNIDWLKQQQNSHYLAPGFLWMFGERAVDCLWLVIPDSDILVRPYHLGGRQPYVDHSQTDLRRARRLFPEARVIPIQWDKCIPDHQTRAFYELGIMGPDGQLRYLDVGGGAS